MRVLITGAAGFIGSRAAMHFADEQVFAVDVPSANLERLEALAPQAEYVACDLHAAGAIEELIARTRPELCLHFAWHAVPGQYVDAPENLDHLAAACRLAQALYANGCRRLATAGTCAEYDSTFGLLSERTPTDPHRLYSASKLAMFLALREACRVWQMSYCHMRLFYLYGPWEAPGRLLPSLARDLLAGGEPAATAGDQICDFLHVDDVGRAAALVARSSLEGAVNIGSGVPVRVGDVARAVERACDRVGRIRFGALPMRADVPPFVCAEISKLRSIGWTPRFSLQAGVDDAVAWFRTHP